jgi:universal stress protein E
VVVLFIMDAISTDTSAGNEAIYRDETYISDIVAPLREHGIKVTVRISWSKDWADSILHSANTVNATSIMISFPGGDANKTMGDDFWYLMRNSSVPVAFIQPTEQSALRKVLMAMDLTDPEIKGLNSRIMETGMSLAAAYGAELHLGCAYGDSTKYPDRGRIVNLTGLPNEHIHFEIGEADGGLAVISQKIEPDLLIIGATRRTGIKAALRGKKISRIVSKIKHDIIVVV